MKYLLIERQGAACYYTIGCGIRTTVFEATSDEAALKKAAKKIGDAWRSENGVDEAELYKIAQVLDIVRHLEEMKTLRGVRKARDNQVAQRASDEDEFERLRKKLGK